MDKLDQSQPQPEATESPYGLPGEDVHFSGWEDRDILEYLARGQLEISKELRDIKGLLETTAEIGSVFSEFGQMMGRNGSVPMLSQEDSVSG